MSTFPIIVASVLAAELLAEFETTRAQIGLLTTASGLVGALASPWMGRLTDILGFVTATRLVLITGAATLAGLAIGPPLMGLSVDVWGTYVPGWLATAFLLALSAVVSFKVPSGSTIGR